MRLWIFKCLIISIFSILLVYCVVENYVAGVQILSLVILFFIFANTDMKKTLGEGSETAEVEKESNAEEIEQGRRTEEIEEGSETAEVEKESNAEEIGQERRTEEIEEGSKTAEVEKESNAEEIEQERRTEEIEQENKNKKIKQEYLEKAQLAAKQRCKPKTVLNYEIKGWRRSETFEWEYYGTIIFDVYFNGIHREFEWSPFRDLINKIENIDGYNIPEALCYIFAEYNILEDENWWISSFSPYFKYDTKRNKFIEDINEKTKIIIQKWIKEHENYLCTYEARFGDSNRTIENDNHSFIYKIISKQSEFYKIISKQSAFEKFIKQEQIIDIIWNNLTEDVLGDWFYPDLEEYEATLVCDAYQVCNNEDFETFRYYLIDDLGIKEEKKIYNETKKIYELFKNAGKWDDLCRKYIDDYAICEKYIEKHYKILSLKWKQTHYVDEYGEVIARGWDKAVKYFTKNIIKNELINVDEFDKIYSIIASRHSEEIEQNVIVLNTGIDFEHYVENILKNADFVVTRTPTTGDQGVDLIAEKNGKKVAIQCKFYSKPVGNKAVQEVVAGLAYYNCNTGCVVSNNSYTLAAKKLANISNVILANDTDIVDRLNKIALYR